LLQRTVTTAEIIGYDFTKTFVKYDDSIPYQIREIIILKSGESLTTDEMNSIRVYMRLSIWWDNTLNAYGNVKGNRGSGRSVWTTEPYLTTLLSNFNGLDGATAFSDPIQGAYTFASTASLSNDFPKFGATSLKASGGGTYVYLAAGDFCAFGSADFTIDFWIRFATLAVGASQILCGQGNTTLTTGSQSIRCSRTNTNIRLQFVVIDSLGNTLTSSEGTTTFIVGPIYHIALVRYGNTITGYIDGVPNCTLDVTGKTIQTGTGSWAIGNAGTYTTTATSKAYIDEFRISKGIARWTADFSASLPSAAYTRD
jgi:hypothetical protein